MTCRTLVLSLIALSGCDISVVFEPGDCAPWEECPDEPTGTVTYTDTTYTTCHPDYDGQGDCTGWTYTEPYEGGCDEPYVDYDRDGTENLYDEDDDGDGVPDAEDDDCRCNPEWDVDCEGGTDWTYTDPDPRCDPYTGECDCETPDLDLDGDGEPNLYDEDDDGDQIEDQVDEDCPCLPDVDLGCEQTVPTDPYEPCEYEPNGECSCNGTYDGSDWDGDGAPDYADEDDDNDGWEDAYDGAPCDLYRA